jgi:ATP-dependent DNA helicase RecG
MLTSEEIKIIVSNGEGFNVDFKIRVPSKVRELSEEICSFANAAGGYVLIGIDDANNIHGVNIDNGKRSAIQDSIRDISPALYTELYPVEVDNKTVWVIEIPSGKNKPYVLSGAIYVREGANSQKLVTAEELRAFFQQCDRIFFDEVSCPDFDHNTQIDLETFEVFRQESHINQGITPVQILNNLQVFDKENRMKRGGVLFFGKHPEDYFYQAVIRCVRFKGINKVHIIDDKTYGGSILQQYRHARNWVQDKMEVSYIIEGMESRKEIWEIPLEVFKEAIINAICHRDYYEKGATIMLEVYDDRVTISNPGGLLPVVKKSFGTMSMSRNPLIFGLFTRMHLVEKVGSGIPRMQNLMIEAGLPEPVYQTEGFFSVTFLRPSKGDIHSTEENKVKLTVIQKEILKLMIDNSKITFIEMINTLHISNRTLNKHVKFLQDMNFIKREGSKRSGDWIVFGKSKEENK